MNNDEVCNLQVKVSPKQVHNSVRNILANEMNFDTEKVKLEVQQKCNKVIDEKIITYLQGQGYGSAELKSRVERTLKHYEQDFVKLIKEALKEHVRQIVQEEFETVFQAVVKEGIQISVGWNKKIKLELKKD